MSDETPMLSIYKTTDQAFSSLWLKTVVAVDLRVHCIDSLIGQRFRNVNRLAESNIIRLDKPAPAWYLCGLPAPYRWETNSHLLAVPAPGEEHEWAQPSFDVILQGCRPVAIDERAIDPASELAKDDWYRTCRNWQAAWILHREFGLVDKPNPAPGSYNNRGRKTHSNDAPNTGKSKRSARKPDGPPCLW